MKYPIGTILIPHEQYFTGGVVAEHKGGKYRIEWDDSVGNNRFWNERQLDEIIRDLKLSWRLPYTINHDFDEDLFTC